MPAKEVDEPLPVSSETYGGPMRVVIVAAGDLAHSDARWLDDADMLVAADGGARALDELGRLPDLVIGDLDSAEPSLVDRLEAAGTRVERHPADKDASDLELALLSAVGAGADEIVLLGALGGTRLDHELANLLLLTDDALAACEVRIVRGRTTVRVLRGGDRLALSGDPGDLATLLPIGGDAAGVTTHGLHWPLEGATLRMGRSRGLSNSIASLPAYVFLERGALLVVETSTEGSPS
jgi:thiamine pyrophosphokinase